jgi:hypothetical protein
MIRPVAFAAAARPRRADGPVSLRRFGRLRGSISPAVVDSLADAITTEEGFYPGSLAWRNNNPGNLVYANQAGASPGEGGFAKFSTAAAGRAALEAQINLDVTRGADVNGNPVTDIAELISSWAPASQGNDTAAYISNVGTATGFDVTAPFESLSAGGGAGFNASSLLTQTVDLSGVGLPSAVPVAAVAGAALVGLLLLH